MVIDKDDVGLLAFFFTWLVTGAGLIWKLRTVFGKVEMNEIEIADLKEAHKVEVDGLKKEHKELRSEIVSVTSAVNVLSEQVKGIVSTTDLKLERLNDSLINIGDQFSRYHDINNDTLKALHASHENNNKNVSQIKETFARIESRIEERAKNRIYD